MHEGALIEIRVNASLIKHTMSVAFSPHELSDPVYVAANRIIDLVNEIIEAVPDGLGEDIDLLENTFDGQAKLRASAKLLNEAIKGKNNADT